MADEPDYYAVLDVAPDADQMQIRVAYRRLARRFHPDVVGEAGAARMKALNVAYQVLSDPEERRRYDLRRGVERPPTAAPASPHAARPSTPRPRPPRAGVRRQTGGPLRLLATLAAPEPIPIASLAFAQGGLMAGLGLLDGRVLLHDLRAGPGAQALSLGMNAGDSSGVLQELRLSPSGAYAATWGLLLGTRAWRIADGAPLWHAAIDAPSGLMDGAVLDGSASAPPVLRLAVPDAPLALAADDPFLWAVKGSLGTAVYSRPLAGAVSATAAAPLRCEETRGSQGAGARDGTDAGWHIRHRALAADGQLLLTLATGTLAAGRRGVSLSLWDLDARTLLGVPMVKRIARIAEPEGALTFPLATTPDLAWLAASDFPVGLVLISLRGGARRGVGAGPVRAEDRLALSPDAAYVAIARGEHLELWETRTGRRAQELGFATEVSALAFAEAPAPMLAVGLANGLAEVWG
jgi:hypothetical protein